MSYLQISLNSLKKKNKIEGYQFKDKNGEQSEMTLSGSSRPHIHHLHRDYTFSIYFLPYFGTDLCFWCLLQISHTLGNFIQETSGKLAQRILSSCYTLAYVPHEKIWDLHLEQTSAWFLMRTVDLSKLNMQIQNQIYRA